MAERKAVNKYYPPDWDPSKGSLNTFHGSHPLRERASKLRSHGILVVRFEMPFHIRCLSCQSHIGRGVRYNADKQSTGHYLSTPTFSFTITCHLCGGRIRIDTDPQAGDYVIKEGGSRIAEGGGEDDDRLVVGDDADDEERQRRDADPLQRLEREAADKAKGKAAQSTLSRLLEHNERRKDDFGASLLVRAHMRQLREDSARKLRERTARGLGLDLLDPHEGDRLEAETVRFGPREGEKQARKRRRTEVSRAQGFGLSRAPLDEAVVSALTAKSRRRVSDVTLGSDEAKVEEEKAPQTSLLQRLVAVQRREEGKEAVASTEEEEQTKKGTEGADAGIVRSSPSSALQSLAAYASDED